MRHWLAACLIIMAFQTEAEPKRGAGHIALVIGVSLYDHGPDLPNATADAMATERALRALGYQTFLALNVDRGDLLLHLAHLRVAARDASQVVIFFSGHGVQRGGESYLFPRDTHMTALQIAHGAVPVRVLVKALSDKPRQKILLLDACRDNPVLATAPLAAPPRDMSPAGLFIGFAAQPGQIAFDGPGRLSPFTTALIEQLGHAPRPLDEVMRAVRLRVIQQTDGRQIPWSQSSLLRPAVLKAPSRQRAAAHAVLTSE